ncbi:MAG: hypothetical protein QOJ31_1369, partial [Gaiellales bacterium]|nr:hypothetical protein [Gaiellales bacterium]
MRRRLILSLSATAAALCMLVP